jgi:hypothetical protein
MIRSLEEQVRVQERLLIRGNTLGGVVAAVLLLLANESEIPAEELLGYANELRSWTADVRAVSSEEAP